MTETVYRCNQCRRTKSESNHWIAMRETQPSQLSVFSFDQCTPEDEHYCGPACAMKRFAVFVDQVRKPEPVVESEPAEKES